MKIILRNKRLDIKYMGLKNLSRLSNCLQWEMEKIMWNTKVKHGKPPKYEMLQLARLIILKKMENKLKNRKELVITNF